MDPLQSNAPSCKTVRFLCVEATRASEEPPELANNFGHSDTAQTPVCGSKPPAIPTERSAGKRPRRDSNAQPLPSEGNALSN